MFRNAQSAVLSRMPALITSTSPNLASPSSVEGLADAMSRSSVSGTGHPQALAEVVQSAVEAARPFIDQARHELTVTLPEPRDGAAADTEDGQ